MESRSTIHIVVHSRQHSIPRNFRLSNLAAGPPKAFKSVTYTHKKVWFSSVVSICLLYIIEKSRKKRKKFFYFIFIFTYSTASTTLTETSFSLFFSDCYTISLSTKKFVSKIHYLDRIEREKKERTYVVTF